MRRLLTTLIVAFVAGLAFTSVATAAPLKVTMKSVDGKARIKVKKKLPVLITCSKACAGRLTLTLVTPERKDPVSGKIALDAAENFKSRYLLTKFGLHYLRSNASRSKLKVKVSVRDAETGKRSVKRRNFKFYK